MEHHHAEKKEGFDLYYLVGIIAGIITGAVIHCNLTFIVVGAIMGLLFTAFFLSLLVKGREDA